jgi:hypothetical protein
MPIILPSSRQFTLFPELPTELRLKIWGFAAVCDDRSDYCRYYNYPIFLTNKEAREVALNFTIPDIEKHFLSIKDQLPTSYQNFQFIAKSPMFDICTFVNATSSGNHLLTFKYAEKGLKVALSLHKVKVGGGEKLVKEWSGFLKSSLEFGVDYITGSDDPEKLGETLRKDALALNNYASYSCIL